MANFYGKADTTASNNCALNVVGSSAVTNCAYCPIIVSIQEHLVIYLELVLILLLLLVILFLELIYVLIK